MLKMIRFTAPWCKPCQAYSVVFQKATSDWNVETDVVDVDDYPGLANFWKITNIPTTIFTNEREEEICRLHGARTYTELVDFIKELKDDA